MNTIRLGELLQSAILHGGVTTEICTELCDILGVEGFTDDQYCVDEETGNGVQVMTFTSDLAPIKINETAEIEKHSFDDTKRHLCITLYRDNANVTI